MKLIHLSDLHLGKRVNEFSMLEDQAFILHRILEIIAAERPDGVLIAGDVYDKPVPPAEAVELFDRFLTDLAAAGQQVFVISGNHDSPERIAFGARLMDRSGIHLSPVYDGSPEPVTLRDDDGPVRIWLLPFLKPAHVRRWFPQEEIASYTDALRTAVAHLPLNTAERNVLVTHQFVTGASRCESEEVSVGGTDNVDASVFEKFDYVALGHIHNPQQVTRPTVRYCGTPLKYSFSEAKSQKSVTVAELGPKGTVEVRTVPLVPQREMREIRGTYQELTLQSYYAGTDLKTCYLHVTLTDEDDVPDAIGKLRAIYPGLMRLDYDNARTRSNAEITGAEDVERKSPLELFESFYQLQNNQPMSAEQRAFAAGLIEKIWGDEA